MEKNEVDLNKPIITFYIKCMKNVNREKNVKYVLVKMIRQYYII